VKLFFMVFTSFTLFMVSAQPAQQQPPFRTAVDLVEVDVTVVDRNGKPVTDLTAADFDIRERGQTQRVDTIFLVTADPALLKNPGAASGPPTSTDPAVGDAVPRRPLQPRVFIFIFDMTHLSAAGLDRTRSAVRSFLADGLRPIDLAGLVVNGTMLGNRIESDKKTLLDQLNGIGPPNLSRYSEMRIWPRILTEEEAARIARNEEKIRDAAVERACAERPGDCAGNGRFAVESEVEQKGRQIASESARDAQIALDTMLTLARGLGKFPGPKQVVLFSEGFYTGDFQDRVKDIAGQSARHRVRISTLDARGLGSDLRQQGLLGEAPVVGTTDFGANLGFDENADVLTTLALDTGGMRVRGRNDLRPALDAIAAEAGTYYLLGYSPQEPFDDSYRTIDVRVRRPGVTVRARRGYLAAKVSPPATAPSSPALAPTGGAAPPSRPSEVPASPPPATSFSAAGGTGTGVPAAAATTGAEPRLRLRPDGPAHVASLTESGTTASPSASDAAARLAREGWDLYSAGNVEGARERLSQAAAAGAGVWVDYALGLAEFALDHFDASVAAWERVRRVKPDFEPVYFDLADAFRRLERSDDSLAVLREAARRWPDDAETHNAVGVTLVGRGAYDDALEAFNKATAVAPADAVGYYNLGRTYELRSLRMLKAAGQDPLAARSLADRDRKNAIAAFTKCVEMGGPYADKAKAAISVLNWR
jgi:VWFA-related protein